MKIFLKLLSIVILLLSCNIIYTQIPDYSQNVPAAETHYLPHGLIENKTKLIEKRSSLRRTGPLQKSTKLKDKITGSVTKRSIGDFSLGAGAAFRYNFAVAYFLLSANLGFKLSRHFALVNGAEFVFWKTPRSNYYYHLEEEIRLVTGLYIAPSYYLQIKKFIFYAGGGICGWLPEFLPTLNLFLMTSTGYHVSEDLLLKLSVRVPVYGEGLGLTGAVMYSFLF